MSGPQTIDELTVYFGRPPCPTCGWSGMVESPDCDCSRIGSENYSLCPHEPDPCPTCRPWPGDAP